MSETSAPGPVSELSFPAKILTLFEIHAQGRDSVGPITLFDKSFLQALSLDEAVWFDHYSYPVITPTFFAETLGDLAKVVRPGRTPEDEVRIIADKTPEMGGGPCYYYGHLCLSDLMGHTVPLTGQIPIAHARAVQKDGKVGAIFDAPDEYKAFSRWQKGRFQEVERNYAGAWRRHIQGIDLSIIERSMKATGLEPKNCRTVKDAKRMAEAVVARLTRSVGRFNVALDILGVPDQYKGDIRRRWKRSRHPPLLRFAPYAAYVLTVEVFFWIAIGANLVASTRPSHRIDMSYLFYLPFCNVFVSSDKLHRLCAPIFIRDNQSFLWGLDLKADLADINRHFLSLDPSQRKNGIMHFANRLPDIDLRVLRKAFERHTPTLLKPPKVNPGNLERDKSILKHLDAWQQAEPLAGPPPRDFDNVESVVIERHVRPKRGSWEIFSPDKPGEEKDD